MPKRYKEDLQGKPDLTKALGVWAMKNNITPIQFSRDMRWSYTHAWRVLRDKGDKFVPAAFGDFILGYGMDTLEEVFKIAGVDPNEALK